MTKLAEIYGPNGQVREAPMSASGYKQTYGQASENVRFALESGHSGLHCAFSATNFKLRQYA